MVKIFYRILISFSLCLLHIIVFCQSNTVRHVVVPITLDHNRMLVDAEMQRKDGTWRKVRFWVDSGNPTFLVVQHYA